MKILNLALIMIVITAPILGQKQKAEGSPTQVHNEQKVSPQVHASQAKKEDQHQRFHKIEHTSQDKKEEKHSPLHSTEQKVSPQVHASQAKKEDQHQRLHKIQHTSQDKKEEKHSPLHSTEQKNQHGEQEYDANNLDQNDQRLRKKGWWDSVWKAVTCWWGDCNSPKPKPKPQPKPVVVKPIPKPVPKPIVVPKPVPKPVIKPIVIKPIVKPVVKPNLKIDDPIDDVQDSDENVAKKPEEGSERQYCDVIFAKSDTQVTIDKKMIDMKFLKGKIAMIGSVTSKAKDCAFLNLGKCMSTSRNQLARSAFLKATNLNQGNIRFSFHFFVGFNREMGLCSVRVAKKQGKVDYSPVQKVMSYVPSEFFEVEKYTTQKTLNSKDGGIFADKSSQDALELCAKPFESAQTMFISNFYQTFEGFLLSQSHVDAVTMKCEKIAKQTDVLFRAVNDEKLKKVDVFINNKDYTQIAIKADATRVSVTEKIIEEAKMGDNIVAGIKAFSLQIFGLSYYNFGNTQCYDLDRQNVAKSSVQTSYTPGVIDNNSEFKFDVAVMAQEGPSGTMCAVYGLVSVPQENDKYIIQNDLLVKFKKGSDPITNDNCGAILKDLVENVGKLEMYNPIENRYLAGALINSVAVPEHKVYCHINVQDNVSQEQFRQDQYNRIFYNTVITQYVDYNQEDSVNNAIQAQLDAIKKKITAYQEIEVAQPAYNVLPYDLTTRKDVKDVLKEGETLANNDFLRSKSGLFTCIIKNDNNLCVYLTTDRMGGVKKLWCSGSANADLGKGVLKMGTDGILKVENTATQAAIYQPNGAGNGGGYFLMIQNDGNLVVYNKDFSAMWASGSQQNPNYFTLQSDLIQSKVQAPFNHHFGMVLRSKNGHYILLLEQGGDLTIQKHEQGNNFSNSKSIWSNGMKIDIKNKMTSHIEFGEDGNLVHYSGEGKKLQTWHTNSQDKKVSSMELTDEGLLNLLDEQNKVVWSDSLHPNDLWTGVASHMLNAGETLPSTKFLRSRNGRFVAHLEDTLCLKVLVKTSDKGDFKQWWSSCQADSNIVSTGGLSVNNAGQVIITNTQTQSVTYSSGKNGKGGNGMYLAMQDDGNLVTYNNVNQWQWAAGQPSFDVQMESTLPTVLQAGFKVHFGYLLKSPNLKYTLRYVSNGQIQVREGQSTVLWTTEAQLGMMHQFSMNLQMKQNGLLQEFQDENTVTWTAPGSQQQSPNGFNLKVTDEGQLVLSDKDGIQIWNPFKMTQQGMFTNQKSQMVENDQLKSGECLNDPNNMFAACMQPNGNFILYIKKTTDGTPTQLTLLSECKCSMVSQCVLMLKTQLYVFDTHTNQICANGQLYDQQAKLIEFGLETDGTLKGKIENSQELFTLGQSQLKKWGPYPTAAIPSRVVMPRKFYPGVLMVSPNGKHNLYYDEQYSVMITSNDDTSKVQYIFKNDGDKSNPSSTLDFESGGSVKLYIGNKEQWKWITKDTKKVDSMQLSDEGKLELLDSEKKVIEAYETTENKRLNKSLNDSTKTHHYEKISKAKHNHTIKQQQKKTNSKAKVVNIKKKQTNSKQGQAKQNHL